MKVDNKTNVALNQKRNTVRITTKDRFAVGSVWIADMLHVPFGVSLFVVSLAAVVVAVSQPAASCLYKFPALHPKSGIDGEPSSGLSPRVFSTTSGTSTFCIMHILTPLARGAFPLSACLL